MAPGRPTAAGSGPPAPGAWSDEPLHFDEYDVNGYRVLVGAPGPHPLAEARGLLRGFNLRPPGGEALPTYELGVVGGRWEVRCSGMSLPMERDFASALGVLEWHVVRDALATRRELFHLHGAALAAPSGEAAIVIAGDSGSGKSTLTLALMARGFAPYADDVALIAPGTLDVDVLRRAFHADADSLRLVEACCGAHVPVEHVMPGFILPAAWASRSLPVRWVLFLELRPNESPRLVPLAPAEAAPRVLALALNLDQSTSVGMRACSGLTARAGCYRMVNGRLEESAALVERLASGAIPRASGD